MSANTRNSNSKHRIRWEWDTSLLMKSVAAIGVLSVIAAAMYFWQSSSMASELLSQANNCEQRGDNKEKIKWLSRYVRLVPKDVQQLASLAFAVDAEEVMSRQNVEFVRGRLAEALIACANSDEHKDLSNRLRRKLIPRLLQLGSEKAPEAEKHILLLEADESDALATKWLAESLFMQRTDSEYQIRDFRQYERSEKYWQWLASQPTGFVVKKAVEANPSDAELAQKLLYICSQQPGWFSGGSESPTNQQLIELSDRVLQELSLLKDDGLAQFLVYSYAASSDSEKAGMVLAGALDSALARLGKFVGRTEPEKESVKDAGTNGKTDVAKLDDVTLNAGYAPVWDWNIALERSRFASKEQAEQICEKLTNLSTEKIPPELREQAYQRLAVLKMERGADEESIEICRLGLASVKRSSLLNRVIAVANLKLEKVEEAEKAIAEIESQAELRLRELDGAPGLAMTASEKTALRQTIAIEQWNANVLRGRIALIRKNYLEAAKLLRDCFKTSIAIGPESRFEAGLYLASCYSATEQWDLVGEVYEQCALLRPKDKEISIAAIRAWRRAGSSERASKQVAAFENVTFVEALEFAQVLAATPSVDEAP